MSFHRILFRFSKESEARFLSHRDLMRLFDRALRRAGLPVRMTQGFNPHPKLSILAALSVGVEAGDEAMEIEFEGGVDAAEVLRRLGGQLPQGVRLLAAEVLPEGARARIQRLAYEADLPPECTLGPADAERLLACETLVVRRETGSASRDIDIRPPLRALAIERGRVRFEIEAAASGGPRASEVVAALLGGGGHCPPPPEALRLRRVRVDLAIAALPAKTGTGATTLRKDNGDAA